MTKQEELEAVIQNPLSDDKQRADAQSLLDKLNSNTSGFDPLAEMWANVFRTDANPERRAQKFEEARERFKTDPNALRSFTPEREHLRAKRNVYDQHGGDVVGYAFDEGIPALLIEKGVGYRGTAAYYREMRGMTPEAAEKQVKKDELFKKVLALREQNGRTIDPSMFVDQLTAAIADRKQMQGEEMRLWKDWESA
jgi:hypothetical protein